MTEISGNAGTLMWTLNDGALTISGNGKMPDYAILEDEDSENPLPPWYSHNSNITTVMIENGVENIGEYAFANCYNLNSITIPDGVTSIGKSAFYGCDGLISIMLPDSITFIGRWAFFGCNSLISATIPKGMTYIEHYVFALCKSLTSITIPNSITKIGDAFLCCESLKHIYLQCATPPVIHEHLYEINVNDCILHVHVGSKDRYEQTKGWKKFKNIQEDIKMSKYIAVYKSKISVDGLERMTEQTYEFSSETEPSESVATSAIKKYISFLNDASGKNTYQFVELVSIRKANVLDKIENGFQKK